MNKIIFVVASAIVLTGVFACGFHLGALGVKETVYRNRFILYKGGAIIYKTINIDEIRGSVEN